LANHHQDRIARILPETIHELKISLAISHQPLHRQKMTFTTKNPGEQVFLCRPAPTVKKVGGNLLCRMKENTRLGMTIVEIPVTNTVTIDAHPVMTTTVQEIGLEHMIHIAQETVAEMMNPDVVAGHEVEVSHGVGVEGEETVIAPDATHGVLPLVGDHIVTVHALHRAALLVTSRPVISLPVVSTDTCLLPRLAGLEMIGTRTETEIEKGIGIETGTEIEIGTGSETVTATGIGIGTATEAISQRISTAMFQAKQSVKVTDETDLALVIDATKAMVTNQRPIRTRWKNEFGVNSACSMEFACSLARDQIRRLHQCHLETLVIVRHGIEIPITHYLDT
jgi:hypothetical protein